MKVYGILLMVLLISPLSTLLYAEETESSVPLGPPETKSLREISVERDIPVKKLLQLLGRDLTLDSSLTLEDLDISSAEAGKALEKYKKIRNTYLSSIVLVGMIIVFASLTLISIIIGQLKHLDEKKKKTWKRWKKSKGKASSSADPDDAIDISTEKKHDPRHIAAVIATMFLHEQHAEEENQIILTWRRVPMNMWKTIRPLPNQTFFDRRRG